jgi:AcrR family transcriptional regulator
VTESTPTSDQPLPRGVPRRPRGRPRITPHPTATLLLDTAVELLDSVSIDGLTIAMILERSGVSYGSLYHHYADISDLVEQAVVHRFTRRTKQSLDAVRALLDSTDSTDFRQRAEDLIIESVSPERRQNRLERAEVIGALQGRPRLVEKIARAQQEITDAQAEIFQKLQQRGWMRSDVDPVAQSAFVQAVILGRVIDDISEQPIDRERWIAVALPAFRAVMFPD